MISFPTKLSSIYERLEAIDPIKYGTTRNYSDGALTYLSPYISRGVISTKIVFEFILKAHYAPKEIESFLQELAWRDYWQQVWKHKKATINWDIRHAQEDVAHNQIPKAILNGSTGIEVIDTGLEQLFSAGYMHNHLRMYTAAIVCNLGKSHWLRPAQWMYYHLLDGDWASNALSWQWVAGTNASKKYYANQQNINKYFYSNQRHTFLDLDYPDLVNRSCPAHLFETQHPNLNTQLPKTSSLRINPNLSTLIYNYYNFDPLWRSDANHNRILLLEPSIFELYPVAPKSIDFILALGKNIEALQIYVGEFDTLKKSYDLVDIIYKEHPLNDHYVGLKEPRDWMFEVEGYFPSFFAFWKKCKKQLS